MHSVEKSMFCTHNKLVDGCIDAQKLFHTYVNYKVYILQNTFVTYILCVFCTQ